jgi:spermidine/putrescine transport system permease protein
VVGCMDRGQDRVSNEAMTRRFWDRMILPGGLWLLVLFAAPLALTVLLSFASTDDIGRPVYDSTLDNYRYVADAQFLPVLVRTLALAALTTVVCLAVGYPLAYYVARFGQRFKVVLLALIVIPFAVNYLVRIYAWLAILGRKGVLNSALGTDFRLLGGNVAVIIGLVYGYLTFMILPIYAVLDRMDPSVIEAAKDLHATPRQAFFRVTLPSSLPGVVAGCILVFLPTVGDFASSQILGQGNVVMVGNLINQQFSQSSNWPLGAAFIVVMMLIVIAIVAVQSRLVGGGKESML